jgi:hypothetical protein
MSYFNRIKWWGVALILLVVLNLYTLTSIWLLKSARPKDGGPPQSGVVDFLVRELGFDSVQKQALIKLRSEHQQQMMKIRRNNRDAKNEFFSLLDQQNLTDSALEKAARASVYYDEQTDMLTFRHFQAIKQLCTESQKQKFDHVIQEVLRMMAPEPPGGNPQRPPPRRRPGDRPPPDGHRPPPPEDGPPPQ